MEQVALAKLADSKKEQFQLVTVDMERATVTKLETGLSEDDVRSHFNKMHLPESEINNRIAAVRRKPV